MLVALTTGTFFKEQMAVEERQPMALSVGYSPSDSTCCSPAKAGPSKRIQLVGRSVPGLTRPSWWASILPLAPQHPCPAHPPGEPPQAPVGLPARVMSPLLSPAGGSEALGHPTCPRGLCRSVGRRRWARHPGPPRR